MYGELKIKILELRKQGYTYNKIKETLGCSKGTISFHCGDGQKEKSNLRLKKRRKNNPLIKKIEQFHSKRKTAINEHYNKTNEITDKTILSKLVNKVHFFFRKRGKKYRGYNKFMFTADEFLEKIGNNPVCYLTGIPIDLNKSRSYHLDHIVPKSRGGDDSLDNCQIACRAANQAKGDLLVEEFIELCKKVIQKNCQRTKNGSGGS